MVTGIQTDDGSFQRKEFDEIESDREDRAIDEFGENVDLSQGSPVKQLLDVGTLEHERLWQVLEHLYYAGYYEDAYGDQLDKILSLVNIQREPRQGATGEVVFRTFQPNEDPVTIPRGTRVTTSRGDGSPAIPFKTMDVATLDAGEMKTERVPIKALEPWETELAEEWLGFQTNLAANTVTRLASPVSGIDQVYNPYPTGDTNVAVGYDYVSGRDGETDHQLRRRWEDSIGASGKASLDALRATVHQVPRVEDVAIEENVTMQDNTDDGGLPPKSFRLTVLGGDNNEIAQVITETRAAGIQSWGSEQGIGVTDDGVERTERFDLADEVTIYVDADLNVDASFPDDGNKRAENAIVEYIGGTTVDGDSYRGLSMDEDVVYDQVLKRIINVKGVISADLFIGTTEPPTDTENLPITTKEAAITSGGAITVTNDGDMN